MKVKRDTTSCLQLIKANGDRYCEICLENTFFPEETCCWFSYNFWRKEHFSFERLYSSCSFDENDKISLGLITSAANTSKITGGLVFLALLSIIF